MNTQKANASHIRDQSEHKKTVIDNLNVYTIEGKTEQKNDVNMHFMEKSGDIEIYRGNRKAEKDSDYENTRRDDRHCLIAQLWIRYYGKCDSDPESILYKLEHVQNKIDEQHRTIRMERQGK